MLSESPSFPLLKLSEAAREKKEEKIIIKLVNLERAKVKRQVVETLINKQKLDKADKAFLGKKTTTFARQTKAANSGSFKEAGLGNKNGRKKSGARTGKVLKEAGPKDLRFSDLAAQASFKRHAVKKKKVSVTSAAKGLKNGKKDKAGLSRSSDYLEEIPLRRFHPT